MRSKIIGLLVGALAALVAWGGSAFAHPYTYTVSVNGSTTAGTHLFYASSVGGIDFSVWNGLIQTDMLCEAVNLEGEVYSGTGIDPVGVVKAVNRLNTPETFSHSEWKDCVGPLGIDMTVVPLNEWEIHPDEVPVTPAQADVVDGYVSGPSDGDLLARVYYTPGGPTGTFCNFIVTGRAIGEFDEAAQRLTINEVGRSGRLSILSATGNCGGLVPPGAVADFEGVFAIGEDDSANTKGDITEFLDINLISSP